MTKVDCARCEAKECRSGRKDCFGLGDTVTELYSDEDLESMRVSGRIEAEHYMKITRLEELIMYARGMGWRKLGIAFCIGLSEEARLLTELLSDKGFQVSSVCCKVCGTDKRSLGVPKLHEELEREAVCNPVAQAKLLDDSMTDLNLIVGLCIGHDILFTEHSRAPVTTLIVKDRVLAHNPAGAIYSSYHADRIRGI